MNELFSNFNGTIRWIDLHQVSLAAHEITRDPKVRKYLAKLNKRTNKSNYKENDNLEKEICGFSNGRLIHVPASKNGTKNNLVGGDCYIEYNIGNCTRKVKVDIKNSDTLGCCGSICRNSLEQEEDIVFLAFDPSFKKYFVVPRSTLLSHLGELIHYYNKDGKEFLPYNEYKKLFNGRHLCIEGFVEE